MTVYRTCVYIDGFNFYYSIVEKIKNNKLCPYPSLKELCENKLASFPTRKHTRGKINIKSISLSQIYYFTAEVDADGDLQKPFRQSEYNNALMDEDVDVILGKYKEYTDKTGKRQWKEKQSDVNLATRFVYDVCTEKCNYAVIISNDTDFCKAIKFMRTKYPKVVVDVWTAGKTCQELLSDATVCHKITSQDFEATEQIANFGFDSNSVKRMP